MSFSNTPEKREARKEWMKTTGFTLFTDVNDAFLTRVDTQQIHTEITEFPDPYTLLIGDRQRGVGSISDLDDGAVSLYAMTHSLVGQVEEQVYNGKKDPRFSFKVENGIGMREYDRAREHAWGGGFVDVEFPWHFAPAIANASVDQFVEDGVITADDKSDMSLTDWAEIIGSGWFAGLLHDMTFTERTTWGDLGKLPKHYVKGGLLNHMQYKRIVRSDEPSPVLEYAVKVDEEEAIEYATTSLSKLVKAELRDRMHDSPPGSVGCPVARKSVKLPRGQFEHDSHVKNLVGYGTLRVVEERSDDNFVCLVQDFTTIDRTLQTIATQIENYDANHGTPVVVREESPRTLIHEHREPLGLFSWPAESDQ